MGAERERISAERLRRAQLTVPDSTVYQQFGSQTLVVNLESGHYFGLNETAGRMLAALDSAGTIAGALDPMTSEYPEAADQLEVDLLELCDGLLERGLIVVTEPGDS